MIFAYFLLQYMQQELEKRKRRQRIKHGHKPRNQPLPNPQPVAAADGTQQEGPPPGPPPDGANSKCRLGGACGEEIQYNGARQRWEHTGRGDAECFGK